MERYDSRLRKSAPKSSWRPFAFLLILISLFGGFVALAQTTLLAQSSSGQTLWLGRPEGKEFVFDVQIPADFAIRVLASDPKFPADKSYAKFSTEEVNGTSYNLVRTGFTWDKDLRDSFQISYWKGGMLGEAWRDVKKDDPEWLAFIPSLEALAAPDRSWSTLTVLALISDDTTPPTVRLPIPAMEYARAQMLALSEQTVAGTYFPNVKQPADLDAYRVQMLDYGNAGRRDPNFRKDNGAQTATDLTLDMVDTLGGPQKVIRTSDTPPFFPDHILDENLNKAAQFQAEYNASQKQGGHAGPIAWTDPATGKTVNMYEMVDRVVYFGGANAVEAAGGSAPGGLPHGWMKSETHFRPWFNVDKCTTKIGYGAAQADNGQWYFVAVPNALDSCEDTTPAVTPAATPEATPVATTAPAADATTAPTAVATEAPTAAATEVPAAATEAPTAGAPATDAPTTDSPVGGFPIHAGTTIEQGVEYPSETGEHHLIFEPDGNLVIYDKDGNYVWGLDSETDRLADVANIVLQPDGNLNVSDANGDWIWSALNADPDASAYLTLSPEGALQLVSGDTGKVLWASDGDLDAVVPTLAPALPDATATPDAPAALTPVLAFPILAGTQIVQGEKYPSESGDHYMLFQPDGNLAVYNAADDTHVWDMRVETGNHKEAVKIELQSDGNLVATGAGNEYIWSALTENPDASAFLTLSPEGVLQLVSANTGKVLWASDGDLDTVVDVPTPEALQTVADADGNAYNTVKIGNQLWMAENLRTLTCSDGTTIPLIEDADAWLTQTGAALIWGSDVADDAQAREDFGALYNGHAATDACNVCPVDWRVPAAVDFLGLIENLGADAHLQLSDPAFWGTDSMATNASGFAARPGGGQAGDSAGSYDFGALAYFWSATPASEGHQYLMAISENGAAGDWHATPQYGFSIRCVQDIPAPDAPVATTPAIEEPLVISHTEGLWSVAWSPDGALVATGDAVDAAQIWDGKTGAMLYSLSGHTDRVSDVAWSPDGASLASASWDKSLRIWNGTSGDEMLVLSGLEDRNTSVSWSPDGTMVAGYSYFDPNVYVWDTKTGDTLLTLPHPTTGGAAAVAWSPDGKFIAVAPANDTRLYVWDAATGDNVYTLIGHTGTLSDVAWSPDGSKLASGGAGDQVIIWSAADGSEVHTLVAENSAVYALNWSPDGTRIAVSYFVDQSVKIWDAENGTLLHSQPAAGSTAAAPVPEWTPDGSKIAVMTGDDSILVIDPTTGALLETLTGHTGSIYEIAISPDGKRIASVSDDGTLRLWTIAGE